MKRLLSMALASACVSACAHAATLTATPANLVAQITSAQPGDTVQLSAGNYGQVNATNIKKAAPGVTIMPAPGAVVSLAGLNENGSTYLTNDGLHVTDGGVWAQGGADHLVFKNMVVDASDHTKFLGNCFAIRNATFITVDSSDCSWMGGGFTNLDSHNLTITNNSIHDVGTDGIDMAGTTDSVVKGNSGTNLHPPAGAHPDFIQWWGTAITATNNLDIEDNHYTRGATGVGAQGIFGEDGTNITIKGNSLVGPMYNGIGLSRTVGAVIEGNFLQSYADMGTRIIVRGACDQITISGNTAPAAYNYVQAGETPCKTVTISNNPVLSTIGAPGNDTALLAWQAAQVATVAPPAPDPLQAAVDSLKAQLATLEGQVAASTAQAQAAAAAQASLQAQLAQAQSALAAAQQQLSVNAQAFTTIKSAIPGS